MAKNGWVKRRRRGTPGTAYYQRYGIGADFYANGRRVAVVSPIPGWHWRFYVNPNGLRRVSDALAKGAHWTETEARAAAETALALGSATTPRELSGCG